jgi:hypothetical protein
MCPEDPWNDAREKGMISKGAMGKYYGSLCEETSETMLGKAQRWRKILAVLFVKRKKSILGRAERPEKKSSDTSSVLEKGNPPIGECRKSVSSRTKQTIAVPSVANNLTIGGNMASGIWSMCKRRTTLFPGPFHLEDVGRCLSSGEGMMSVG